MSSFAQTEHLCDTLPNDIQQIQLKIDKFRPSRSTPLDSLESLYNEASRLNVAVERCSQVLKRAVNRAEEKDPNRQIYGPSMIKRVKTTNEKFQAIQAAFTPLFNSLLSLYNEVMNATREVEEKRVAAERAGAEAAEAKRREAERLLEEDRKREQENKLRQREERIAKQRELDLQLKAQTEERKRQLIQQKKEELRKQKQEEFKRKDAREQEKRQRIEEKLAKKQQLQQAAVKQVKATHTTQHSTKTQILQTHIDTMKQHINNTTDLQTALQLLLDKVTAIINNPHNAALLKIDLQQDTEFLQKIASQTGGRQACQEIGFLPLNAALDKATVLQMNVSAAQWDKLVQSKACLEEQLQSIQQATSASNPTQHSQVSSEDEDMDEEEMLQRAIAMSMTQNQTQQQEHQPKNPDSKQ